MSSATSILIIDDKQDDIDKLKAKLNQLDGREFAVDEVSCSDEAQEKLRNEQYDLIFLDYILGLDPEQDNMLDDGLDLLKWIRREEQETPLIMLTGYGDAHVASFALLYGANHFLPKSDLSLDLLEKSIDFAIDDQIDL